MENQQIFFSYSRSDGSDFAFRLADDLRNVKLNIWVDQIHIPPGVKWDDETQKALNNSTVILFIVSEASIKSDNVIDEVYYALDHKKKVLPIVIADCPLPYRVNRLQRIDFTKNYERGLKILLEALSDKKKKGAENNESVDITKKTREESRLTNISDTTEPDATFFKPAHQPEKDEATGHGSIEPGIDTKATNELNKNGRNRFSPGSTKKNWKPVKWKNIFAFLLIVLIPVTIFVINRSAQNVKDNLKPVSEQSKDTVFPGSKKPGIPVFADLKKGGDTSPLTDSAAFDPRKQIIRFLEAENSIASDADIQHILSFYTYPMRKNFKYSSVSREHLYNIYAYSYLKKFLYHKITGYENNIKVIPVENNRTRVEVSFQFETDESRDGANKTIQQVSNAYVFNQGGKIESIGLKANKEL